jgi:hypothetical protein
MALAQRERIRVDDGSDGTRPRDFGVTDERPRLPSVAAFRRSYQSAGFVRRRRCRGLLSIVTAAFHRRPRLLTAQARAVPQPTASYLASQWPTLVS